jgi:hypothetical protein
VVWVTAVTALVLTTGIVASSLQLVKNTEKTANSIAGIQNLIFVFIFNYFKFITMQK